jgi:hypothetical protein
MHARPNMHFNPQCRSLSPAPAARCQAGCGGIPVGSSRTLANHKLKTLHQIQNPNPEPNANPLSPPHPPPQHTKSRRGSAEFGSEAHWPCAAACNHRVQGSHQCSTCSVSCKDVSSGAHHWDLNRASSSPRLGTVISNKCFLLFCCYLSLLLERGSKLREMGLRAGSTLLHGSTHLATYRTSSSSRGGSSGPGLQSDFT